MAMIIVLSLLAVAVVSCAPDTSGLPDGLHAVISTDKGEIVIQLEPDRAPLTTMNFVGLAEGSIQSNREGQPFYDGLTFHRVEPGFVIQGGDPDGVGTGGPGYQFPTETHPDLLHDSEGVVAMANSGPDTNGSQFYVTLGPAPHLDGGYNVFGRVIRGMEVVREIAVGDSMKSVKIVRVGDVADAYRPTAEQFQGLVDRVLERRTEAAAALRRESERLIASKWPGAELVNGSGLLLDRTVEGFGPTPKPGDAVSVHFTFELIDGTQIDDTRARGEPYSFTFGEERLIPGLELAIGRIREGGSATAIIPPELAFGPAGIPPVVAPSSYVVFRVDVMSVE
ncbi:MAG: peptidylprolyl isomerase [Spirochaetales bacterium]|nr:peptidylprolyl isomerase [Spirochaetales bacterium]